MKTFGFFLGIMVLSSLVHAATPSTDPDNLLSPELFQRQLSWRGPENLWRPFHKQDFTTDGGVLTLNSKKDGARNTASAPLDIEYETAVAFELTCQYKSTGKTFFSLYYTHPEKRFKDCYYEYYFKAQDQWTTYRQVIPRPQDGVYVSLTFYAQGKHANLTIRNLTVKPVEAADRTGKPVMLAGKRCQAIHYLTGDTAETFYNRHTAKILRSQFRRLGGELLPLRPGPAPAGSCAIVIGGPVPSTVTAGGYDLNVTLEGARIAGLRPGGTSLGARVLLKHMGVDYVTPMFFSKPDSLTCNTLREQLNPAVPFRYPARLCYQELLGYPPKYEFANDRKIGGYRGFGHTGPCFLPYDEFRNTHPEFFALQPDGKRLTKVPGQRFDVHFCMSNPKAMDILASRMIEYMKSEPLATYFSLFPGDGGNKYCRCPECAKMGNLGERNLAWINAVARRVAKVLPHKKITTFAYVDARFPPQTIMPEPNVVVLYCPYEPVWMNHLITDHPANAQGLKDLDGWEKACLKNMGAFVYPSSCREKLNIWPAFYANYAKFRRFARNHYQMVQYCGMAPVNGSGAITASNNFCDLSIYVLGNVLINPELDVEKEIDHFMKLYYGKAAPAMRSYFNRIHREVTDRNWEQNTEKIVRGLVTPTLTHDCYPLFAEAEHLVTGRELYHVQKEKLCLLWHDLTDNCRGNGRIGPRELPDYAQKLAEFCRLAKAHGAWYNTIPYLNWFWDTAMLRIENKGIWYNTPMITKLMDKPLDTLLKSVPDVQKKTDYGYIIENQGILGGERMRANWLRPDTAWVSVLRRPSSGFGTAQLNLKLDALPKQPVIMKISGIDNEKKTPADVEIQLNGKTVFAGKSPWKKDAWSDVPLELPANAFRTGDNTIMILNTTKDTEVDAAGGINYVSKRNYFWGWFMISEVKFILK